MDKGMSTEPVADHHCAFRDAHGRWSAFITKLYEFSAASESSIARELRACEKSRSDVAQEKVPSLRQMLAEHTAITTVLELILQKGIKEERLARLPEELRDIFEAEFGR